MKVHNTITNKTYTGTMFQYPNGWITIKGVKETFSFHLGISHVNILEEE